jgi:hypothetical protein
VSLAIDFNLKLSTNYRPYSVILKQSAMDTTTSTGVPTKTTIDFDVGQFDSITTLVALNIPAKLCTEYLKQFKEFLYQRPRIKRIYDVDGDPDRRLILLSKELSGSSCEHTLCLQN